MCYLQLSLYLVDALFRVPEEYVGRRNLECVEALQENPLNPRQVLIGYSRGLMVLWDLDRRCAIQHFLGAQVYLYAGVRAFVFCHIVGLQIYIFLTSRYFECFL